MKIEEQKLEELIKEYLPEIKIIAQKYYIVGGNVEDLEQEGLIGFVDGVFSYDETRGDINSVAFKKFTLMCAKRQIIDAIKKANSKKNMPLNNSISISGEEYKSVSGVYEVSQTPEDIVISSIENEEKNEEINLKLSKFEKIVLKFYLEGYKQSSIAKMLTKPIKSIENTLQRIKNKLRGKN